MQNILFCNKDLIFFLTYVNLPSDLLMEKIPSDLICLFGVQKNSLYKQNFGMRNGDKM
jgi:hypothetical protein